MDLEAKDRIISAVYYDLTQGFGSVGETLRKARVLDRRITLADVKTFMDKQEIRQTKKPKRYNNFIPEGRLEQIQIDLADFGKRASTFRYGMVAIDSFSKHLAVIPLRGKSSRETAAALDEVLQRLGLSATCLTDEGGEFRAEFEARLKYYEIEHVVTRTPPIFVERVIRTVKEGLELRMRALNTSAWHTLVDAVVGKYNGAKHTTIGMAPEEAVLEENSEAVRDNIAAKAKRNRSDPELDVGDFVKIIRKPGKYSEFKSGFVAWSTTVHQVERIVYENGSRMYKLADRPRPLFRHELLMIEDVASAPSRRVRGKQAPAALLRRTG